MLLAVLLHTLSPTVFSFQPALWQFALAQGAIAAGLSIVWRQPAWWPPLHFGFLPAILLAQWVDAPAWFHLAAFLLLLAFYWSTFRTRVPRIGQRKAGQAWRAAASGQPLRFIDLGSGFGGVPCYLESRFPLGRFYGTELAPAPWLVSRLRTWLTGSRVRFMRRDYAQLSLADFDVVFAFLSPAAMPGLWRQARSQMRSGSLFVSLSFAVDAQPPDRVVTLAEGTRHTLYAWRM